MQLEYQKTLYDMITRFLKQQTTGVLHCVDLLEKVCHALFTNTGLKPAKDLKKEANFA
jgi:hypothetical protein